jgi:DNA polymerase III epsilon subunit family exonuclease
VQLRLDAADRLVELVEERRGPVPAEEAARHLFALAQVPVGMARGLLEETVGSDARLGWRGDLVAIAAPAGADELLEHATFVVVDLETTGLTPGRARICEIGAVRVRALELEERFEMLANPGAPIGPTISALTGLRDADLRNAPPVGAVVRRFLAFAGDAVLVAHNARFDLSFLDHETERLTTRRLGSLAIDTVALARKLVGPRRANLAELSQYFGTAARPCHRALPDAEATAEILLSLIGLAQERGARTVADLSELAATRARRAHAKRSLAFGAPQRPGVYLFRDAHDQVLYVGRARDLRARLRSYFNSEKQRPAVEAALGALERIEWRVLGSEVEAALEELRLIRELRPAANVRSARPDRYVYLRKRGESVVCSQQPGPLGPLRSRKRARLAARALESAGTMDVAEAAEKLRARLRRLTSDLRFEEAARVRDRLAALEDVARAIAVIERLRSLELCILAPAVEPGFRRAFFIANGRVAAVRMLPPGGGAQLELAAGLAAARAAEPSYDPELADELLALGTFLRRPPPEIQVVQLARLVA